MKTNFKIIEIDLLSFSIREIVEYEEEWTLSKENLD